MSARCPDGIKDILRAKTTLAGFGCTPEEARRDLDKKLLDFAVKVREDNNSPCTGECKGCVPPSACVCVTVAEIDEKDVKNGVVEDNDDDPDCPDNDGFEYVCTFNGTVICECYCRTKKKKGRTK